MKLLFKQRFFSWFDSYDIFDEDENIIFTVKGQLSWGHRLNIYNASGDYAATVQEKVFTFLPRFELYVDNKYVGKIQKEFTFFRPKYHIDFNGWNVEGNFFEFDYHIRDANGGSVASVSKELFHLSDTYSINIVNPDDALYVLVLVLAIDAEKCSRN